MRLSVLLLALVLLVGCYSQPKKAVDLPAEAPQVSEEAAVKAAKSADPQASVEGWATWKVRLAENVELVVEGKAEKRTVWIVEATHQDGGGITVYVDAMTYPPKVLRLDRSVPEHISSDVAIQAALNGATEAEVSQAQLIAKFRVEIPGQAVREQAVWVVDLVSKADKRPRSRVLVDAVSGKVLIISSPPSGQ